MSQEIHGYWSASALGEWMRRVFEAMGCSVEDAATASDVLLEADLKGIDSHGVARLPGYVRLWRKGRINPRPVWRWEQRMPAVAVLDADAGLGLVAARVAMDRAVEMAAIYGTAQVLVRNSNHFGIASEHALRAVPHGMVGWAMTNASPLVAPYGSAERLFGTNPLCYAFPAGRRNPMVMDMATSAAANGKLELAAARSQTIPEGWAVDSQGRTTTDPLILQKGGALLPLGSNPAGGVHKGYGLGALVDWWSGVLSGASFGPWVPPFVDFLEPAPDQPGPGLGHALGATAIEALMPMEEYNRRVERWADRILAAETAPGQPPLLLHGMPEWESRARRLEQGIPYTEARKRGLRDLALELGLDTIDESPPNLR